MRALLLSLPALAIPVAGAFLYPDYLEDYEALTWLLALIPAFLLAYYRGWRGVATALALGMALISVTYAVARTVGATMPPLLLGVVIFFIGISLGIGLLTERVSDSRMAEAKETMALRDPLTDLPNRRQAEAHLELEIAAAERGRPVAVALFDFDHFGEFNTRAGRSAADGVLKTFANLLRNHTRRMNLSSRYGPDSFLCVLGGCDEEGALTFAARVQERLRAAESTTAVPTVSVGVAAYRPNVQTVDAMLRGAEDALLLAKQHGRDRVRVYGRTSYDLGQSESERESLMRAQRATDEALARAPLTIPAPAETAPTGPVGAGRSVLVLLSDPAARVRLARLLTDELFMVSAAGSWIETVPSLDADFDIAFVELLPAATSTADQVRELRTRIPGIRIVGVPQAAGGRLESSVLSIRVDGYCTLSTPVEQLRVQLRELLRERDLQRESAVRSRQLSEEVRAKDREARLALAASEARYRAVVQSIQQVIFATDAQGNFTFLNAAWSSITGFNVEEALGQAFWDYVHPEERAALRQDFERLVQQRSPHYRHEGRWRSRSGTYRWIEARFQIVPGSGTQVESTSGVLTDVTDRRHAEEALRRSEEYFRTLIENSADMMAVVNSDGTIRYVSPAVQRVFGYSVSDWYALAPMELVHPEDADRVFEDFTMVLAEGGETRTTELRMRHADGSWRTVEITANNQLATPGVEGVVLNARDITERRRTEAALRESEGMLVRAQKMDAIGRLAGGVAHDFNNLLTAIQGHATLLLEETAETQPIRTDLFEIRDAAERATALTRQLLAFSRRQVLQPRVLDLNLAVADMEKMLRRMVGEHTELVPDLAAPLDLVRADPGQVEQVVLNLVMNARDALPRGGRIVLRTRNQALRAVAETPTGDVPPGDYVMLEVQDDGTGMSPEVAAQAFEPFFTTKEPGQGTGLGLATVYGIVKQSGGHVWLHSAAGAGTTVTVYLPRVVEAVAFEVQHLEAAPVVGGSETVLLVEDEKAVRDLARKILERKGYQVLVAENGRHALEVQAAFSGRIHLLLTDVVMPELDGPELAQRLAAARPDMRVLFMSGYAEEAIAHHGVIGEGHGFMEKPFTPDELLRRVRGALEISA